MYSDLVANDIEIASFTALATGAPVIPTPIKAPCANDSNPPSNKFLSSPNINISPKFCVTVVANSDPPSLVKPLVNCFPANSNPSFIVTGGKLFKADLTPFINDNVPNLSNITSDSAYNACILTCSLLDKFKISLSFFIWLSISIFCSSETPSAKSF